MKKLCIIAMAALVLLTAQCKREPKPTQKVMVPINGSVDFGGGSKTQITIEGYVTPVQGDKIYIYDNENGTNVGYMTCTPTTGQQFNCSGEIEQGSLGKTCTFMYLGTGSTEADGTTGISKTSSTISFANQTGVSVSDGKISGLDKFHVGSCTANVTSTGTGEGAVDYLHMVSKMSIAYFQLKDEGNQPVANQTVNVSGISSVAQIHTKQGTISGNGTGSIAVRTDAEGKFYMALVPQNGTVTVSFAGVGKAGEKRFPNGIGECNFYSEGGTGAPVQVKVTAAVETDEWVNFNDPAMGVEDMPLWAKYNVGVDPNHLDEAADWYGNYYAWGETETKEYYSHVNYKFGAYEGEDYQFTKYCPDPIDGYEGYVDEFTYLLDEDDAAHVTMGGLWHIPSVYEWDLFHENTYWKWTDSYCGKDGLAGYMVYKVKDISHKGKNDVPTISDQYKDSDTHIFIPAAGRFTDHYVPGSNGNYWTNQHHMYRDYMCFTSNAMYTRFSEEYIDTYFEAGENRYWGLSLRAVCPTHIESGEGSADDFEHGNL